MRGGIETLPSSVLQEILNGRLGVVDLARLESCASRFRAPSGIAPYESKSIAEAAAHYSCQMHPVCTLGASCEVRWPLETGVILLGMLVAYAGALCRCWCS
jgi:hypothetical protein